MKNILLLLFIANFCNLIAQSPADQHLDEIVISASRYPDRQLYVAQKIDIIKTQEIEFSNAATTADLIQQGGKLMVQKSQQGGGSPIMRGFEASRILLVVDGIRLNNAIYRAGHLQNIISIDQSIIDRIEIAYGPSSVIYGSDALGGVIYFKTKDPVFQNGSKYSPTGGAFVRYATAASEFSGNLNFNIAKNRFASLTSVSFGGFSDLRSGTLDGTYKKLGDRNFFAETINGKDVFTKNSDKRLQKYSGYTQHDIMEKLLFRQNEKLSHLINFQYSTTTDIPRYDRLTDKLNNDSLRYSEWYYGPQDRLLAAYDLNYRAMNSLFDDMHLIISYQSVEESRHQRRFGRTDLDHRTENVNIAGINAGFNRPVKNNEFRYGVEAYFNSVASEAEQENIITGEMSSLDTRYPDGGAIMNNYAVYMAHTIKFNNAQWVINDGVRYNYSILHATFNDKTFFPFPYNKIDQRSGALTGTLGLIYLPNSSTKISLLGSTGFRTPNVDDLTKVFESSAGSIIIPNPDLKPEYTYNADLALMKIIKEKYKVDITGFYTRFTNYLTTAPGTFNGADSILYDGVISGVLTTLNAGRAYIAGVNAGAEAEFNEHFSASTYITYTYGRIQTDSTPYPLDHIPPIFGRSAVNYKNEKLHAEFYILYSGWKHIKDYNIAGGEDNEQYATPQGMPAWFTLNLKAGYFIKDWIEIQVGCENIIDLNYRVFASGINSPGQIFFSASEQNSEIV